MTAQKLGGLPDETRSPVLKLRCELAALPLYVVLQRLVLAHQACFYPEQLPIPAGQPGGGQWTDSEGSDVILTGARGRGSVSVRIGDQTFEVTPSLASTPMRQDRPLATRALAHIRLSVVASGRSASSSRKWTSSKM